MLANYKRLSSRHRGFTLVETVIAMGIITIMITAFLAAFGPAVQGVRKAISAKEANRLSTTLENELSILRAGNQATSYSTAFEKAYEWIKESDGGNNDAILLYQYRGNPAKVRPDGTLEPLTPTSGQVPGKDYVLQSVVRRFGEDETKIKEELVPGVVEGRVFLVRMRQLVFDKGELILTNNPGEIVDPYPPNDVIPQYDKYPDAVIAFQADYYLLKSSIFAYVEKNLDPDALGKPVFTRNMAVRR